MPVEQIRNFVPASSELATAGQPSEQQVRDLPQDGFEAVVNLGLLDPRYCLADEAGLVRSLGLDYHHIPVDFQAPTREDLQRFFSVMEASRGKKVLVHCAANMRVSAFVALYGEARLGWSPEQAQAFVRQTWEPNEVWAHFIESSRNVLDESS